MFQIQNTKWNARIVCFAYDIKGILFLFVGNEARHFILKEDTNANRNLANTPEQPTYTYREIYGLNVSYVGMFLYDVTL